MAIEMLRDSLPKKRWKEHHLRSRCVSFPRSDIRFLVVCQCKWQLTCRWNLFLWRSRKWRAARTTADALRLRPRRWTRRDSCWPPPPPLNTTDTALASSHASIPTLKPGLRHSLKLQVIKKLVFDVMCVRISNFIYV